ncbi:MAG: hypothetical protein JWN32_2865 [Solirubrobacterales bacterium]|nr:hypothetical protein [Solirubrobacterales bacterium]
MTTVTGTLVALDRYPVKSLAGESLRTARLDRRGLGGDRTHLLEFEHKSGWKRLSAREAPRMLEWRASYPDHPDAALDPDDPPLAWVAGGNGGDGRRWDDPALPRALSESLGRPVRLARDLGGRPDLVDSVLLTTEATRRAVEASLGRPVDLRRFRTNFHVVLDAAAFAEESWEGGRLRVGAAEFEVLHPCERCAIPTRDPDDPTAHKWGELLRWLFREHRGLFGINARALGPAEVRVGDLVRVDFTD